MQVDIRSGDACGDVVRHPKEVAILMGTYNGKDFLAKQLDSFTSQTYPLWKLWVSDDGSTDGTLDILRKYQSIWGDSRVEISAGPGKGFVANFLALTCSTAIKADFYAYSDQDDIWEADKLDRAINWLSGIPENVPALYCSRTRLIDEEGKDVGLSMHFPRQPSFANALVQSIGGGNTMVFNNAARELVREAGADLEMIAHDRWVYLVVAACGGKVFHDHFPTVQYRQHGDNLMGANTRLEAKLIRVKLMLKGSFRKWTEEYVCALQRVRSKMTSESCQILDDFVAARNASMLRRILKMKRCRIYRQTLLGNLGLAIAVVMRRI